MVKKIVGLLIICLFIPPLSIMALNILIMFGFWYFASLGFKTTIRNWSYKRFKDAEARRAYNNRVVDGGVIYADHNSPIDTMNSY